MEIYRFLVVEFDDGLQIIPSNWLINDKSSFFPNYKNLKLYDRAVVSMEIPNTPTTTWDVYNIKKIFKKTDDFTKAKEVLSKAEYRSDFESDSSTALKMRKVYAAKSFSDSDGFDENSDPISNIIPPFPNPPAKEQIYTSTQKNSSGKKCLFNSGS
ncbi:uncharacterized protein LOC111034556 [Myzus persicae]|uniref:uncharacterized protein LOC111034556 n=1 Tax=Myzus persicae TaxID=13164 RepID=UPI000B931032|nr:uncharacterized protein LOC111034556 [Myzus persicae]